MPVDDAVAAEDLLADKKMLSTLNTFISSQSCVLLLGPLFGIDKNEQKIHTSLKNYLTSPPNSLDLDDEFDNLYISKTIDGSQNAYLINEICTYYQTVEPSGVYKNILSIGFRAIISYTSDLLLQEANDTKEYDFSFFSIKGNQPGEQADVHSFSKKPIIYNIFGNLNDLNSLITDYDSLYDFLINILKADQEFPLQLKNILSNARAFLFLGFDLRKWYIPLIIRKFNQFILNGNRPRTSVSAFACLDDSGEIPSPLFTNSLNKYPLTFKPFKQLTSVQLINELVKLPKKPQAESNEPRPLSQTDKDFFKMWDQQMKEYSSNAGLQEFFKGYRQLNYSSLYKKEFDLLNMQYNEYATQKNLQKITEEDFKIGCNNIIASLQHFIEKLIQ